MKANNNLRALVGDNSLHYVVVDFYIDPDIVRVDMLQLVVSNEKISDNVTNPFLNNISNGMDIGFRYK